MPALLERFKELFDTKEVPDEAKQIFKKAATPSDLLAGLDLLLTKNELAGRELTERMEKVETSEREEQEKIRAKAFSSERQKKTSLLLIKRLRKQLEISENRLRIYERNMHLHLMLIDKVQQIEAMHLRGVDEEKIDEIALAFDETLEGSSDTFSSAEAADGDTPISVKAREDKELKQLEQEILGEEVKKETLPEPKPMPAVKMYPKEIKIEAPKRPPIEDVLAKMEKEEAEDAKELAKMERELEME